MFERTCWRSDRMGREACLVRWGHYGQPLLIFPTAGGDAEEIGRFHVVASLMPLIESGRIKVYSCDAIGSRVWFSKEGTPDFRMWMQNQFHQYVKHEVVPAIRMDCGQQDIPIWVAGASIGAFHAVAVTCRFPDIFHRALGMSGTYDLMRFIEADAPNGDFFVCSPIHFLPTLEGPHLDTLRERFVLLASGDGSAENMGETWAMANALGRKGIPNRVDPWGADWHHDWHTWRNMLPRYIGEWTNEESE